MRFDTLCLDAGGVLLFPNWTRVSDTLARHGVQVRAEALAASEAQVKYRIDRSHASGTGAQRGEDLIELVLATAGVTLNDTTAVALEELRQYQAEHNLWELVPADVVPALQRFRELGLRLVVISNANGTLHSCFDRLGLTKNFDVVFDSFREGIEKPDPRLFQRALQHVGARPERALHVGDMESIDVAGARAAGLHPVLLDPYDLYMSCDRTRVHTLGELADLLETSAL